MRPHLLGVVTSPRYPSSISPRTVSRRSYACNRPPSAQSARSVQLGYVSAGALEAALLRR